MSNTEPIPTEDELRNMISTYNASCNIVAHLSKALEAAVDDRDNKWFALWNTRWEDSAWVLRRDKRTLRASLIELT